MTRSEILRTAKPILFGTEMVRAILNNDKTATRRPVKPKSPKACGFYVVRDSKGNFMDVYDYDENEAMFESPQARLHIGDILYVKETWGIYEQNYINANYFMYRADFPNGAKTYDADGVPCDLPTWRPSTRMPKEAVRIFLRVTGVRVERLQDITSEQICREGIICEEPYILNGIEKRYAFQSVWNSTVKKSDLDKYGWDANPWVWGIEFERVEVTE